MSSGINVDADCAIKCNEQTVGHLHKWISYKISDDKKFIVVEDLFPAVKVEKDLEEKEFWERFVNTIVPDNEPRYYTYDFHFEMPQEGKREKVILITWVPDTSAIKSKMLYTTSKEALKSALKKTAFGAEIQANFIDDLDYIEIKKRLCKSP